MGHITPVETILREIGTNSSPIAVDTETTGLNWQVNKVFGVSIAFKNTSYFLRNDLYGIENVGSFLRTLFSLRRPFVFHNLKFDAHMIKGTYSVNVPFDRCHDTFLISYLFDNEIPHGLKKLAERFIDPNALQYEQIITQHLKSIKSSNYELVPLPLMDLYARKDAEYTLALYNELYKKLSPGNKECYETERGFQELVFRMEEHGLLIDVRYLERLNQILEQETSNLGKEIQSYVNYPMDILSDEQVGTILYKKFKLPIHKLTDPSKTHPDGLPSTDEHSLRLLDHPLAVKILRYRKAHKIRYTYSENLMRVDSNNRLHPTWNTLGTRTGRASSSEPNMQNILGHRVLKRAFICNESLYAGDYSQIEYRCAAHVTQEQNIISAYVNDPLVDFHRVTAGMMLGIPTEDVTYQQRQDGKIFNFGIIYGEGAELLAKQLGCEEYEAREKLGLYFSHLPALREGINNFKKQKKRNGYIKTIFDRTIYVREVPDHAIFNYAIQGGCSDLLKKASVNIDRYFNKELKFVNSIHDSFYIEDLDRKIIPDLLRIAEDFNWSVPIKMNMEYSAKDWGSMDPITV